MSREYTNQNTLERNARFGMLGTVAGAALMTGVHMYSRAGRSVAGFSGSMLLATTGHYVANKLGVSNNKYLDKGIRIGAALIGPIAAYCLDIPPEAIAMSTIGAFFGYVTPKSER